MGPEAAPWRLRTWKSCCNQLCWHNERLNSRPDRIVANLAPGHAAAAASPHVQDSAAVAAAPVAAPAFREAVAAARPAEAKPVRAPPAEVKPVGVLLVNLGTPDAPEPAAVRRYLKEFLTDPRVIEKNSVFWKVLLNGLILPIRSRRRARDYKKIWNEEKNELPFKTITRSQAEKLAGILEPLSKHVVVDWAMRYASPSIASRMEALTARGCDRIPAMPLYPQYSAATTATVADEVFRFLLRQRRQPAVRIMPAYYDDPDHIEVLASSLKVELKWLPFEPDVVVAVLSRHAERICRQGLFNPKPVRAHHRVAAPPARL